MIGRLWTDEVRQRIREDFQFAMIVLFGVLAATVISGFVVYRFAFGYVLGGIVNLTIVMAILLVVYYAIRTGDTRRAGVLFTIVTVLACIASTALFGRTGILWGYVVLWVNFLLTSPRAAVIANLVMMTVLINETVLFQSALERVTYIISALMVTVFGWIFATRLAHYQHRLEELALQDPLTFAGNRRMMKRDLHAAVSAHERSGRPYTLVLLDLDHFKQINDDLGHETGDDALRAFCDLVREHIRAEDGFYRMGGEEFVLLLPGHDHETASRVAALLHERISGKLEFRGHPLRFSAGVAVLQAGEAWPDWLGRADQALYRAKRGGRNRVIVAAEDELAGVAAHRFRDAPWHLEQ
ncbi:MAG: GGDEF domain-containing protein [Wenzhouxiangellaceae bacterium]